MCVCVSVVVVLLDKRDSISLLHISTGAWESDGLKREEEGESDGGEVERG